MKIIKEAQIEKIFVSTDDQNIADGLILNLEAEGYQVVHDERGSDTPRLLEEGMFDLILLDIMLPGIDGLTLCRQLRDDGRRGCGPPRPEPQRTDHAE